MTNASVVLFYPAQCGKGAFGEVVKASHRLSHKSRNKRAGWHNVAIKTTRPSVLDLRGGVRIYSYDNVEERCQEVRTLIHLRGDNPNTSCVLHLYEYFWTRQSQPYQGQIHLVTELLGQELDQWRHSQTTVMESSVQTIARFLLNALDFLHGKNVVHRDIKPTNILFRVNGDFRTLKIVDFGLAKILPNGEKAKDFCGSNGYIAPEMYEAQPYDFEVDMFAFGVVLFRLLSGARPFSSPYPHKMRTDTINLTYSVNGRNWEGISSDALKLVRKLLIGREERLTAAQAADHNWFFATQEDSIINVDYPQSNQALGNSNISRVIALVGFSTTHAVCDVTFVAIKVIVIANRYAISLSLALRLTHLLRPSRKVIGARFGWMPC